MATSKAKRDAEAAKKKLKLHPVTDDFSQEHRTVEISWLRDVLHVTFRPYAKTQTQRSYTGGSTSLVGDATKWVRDGVLPTAN